MTDRTILWAALGLIICVGAAVPVINWLRRLWAERSYRKLADKMWGPE